MKNVLTLLISFLTLVNISSCKAQSRLVELTSNEDLNYYLSNIAEVNVIGYSLYSNSVYINVFTVYDSKSTPENFFEGYDGVLQSILITISPDGDYYTTSKTFKIEGLLAPRFISVEEQKYPDFEITVESGSVSKRVTKSYNFEVDF